jgi:hypothetical protein
VRFDTDHMAVTIESYRLHAWQQIPIVEIRACGFGPALTQTRRDSHVVGEALRSRPLTLADWT